MQPNDDLLKQVQRSLPPELMVFISLRTQERILIPCADKDQYTAILNTFEHSKDVLIFEGQEDIPVAVCKSDIVCITAMSFDAFQEMREKEGVL